MFRMRYNKISFYIHTLIVWPEKIKWALALLPAIAWSDVCCGLALLLKYVRTFLASCKRQPRDYKTFFSLNSSEHEIYSAHQY